MLPFYLEGSLMAVSIGYFLLCRSCFFKSDLFIK